MADFNYSTNDQSMLVSQLTSEQFPTSDIGVAAVLLATNHELIDIDRRHIQRQNFIFKRQPHTHTIVGDFWDDKLMLNPRALLDASTLLKKKLYR